MNSYDNALIAIRSFAEQKQYELDCILNKAKKDHIDSLRSALLHGVKEDAPHYPVCLLLSQTIEVLDDSTVVIPTNTRLVLKAAILAKMIPLDVFYRCGDILFHYDGSMNTVLFERTNHYNAYWNSKNYSKNQLWKHL